MAYRVVIIDDAMFMRTVLKKMLSDSKTDREQSYIRGQMKSNEHALKALKDTVNVVLWNVDLEELKRCKIF